MVIAIICNVSCQKTKTDRTELIKKLIDNGCKVVVFGVAAKCDNNIDDTIKFVKIEASRNNVNPFKEIKSLINLQNEIGRNKIDAAIIYGVKNHAAMTIGAYLGGCRRILCVVNGSGNLFHLSGIKGALVRSMAFPLLRIAYQKSVGVGFQNDDDKKLFIDKRLVKDNDKAFVTAGSGVNLGIFSQKPLPEEPRFLFLARITPTKGIKEFVEAARIVKRKYPKAIFDVVGPLDTVVEGNINEVLDSAVADHVVSYHGATTDVPRWMERCRVFVYPSYREGVPRCSIQAIATGRPIITCDSPGCRETVIDKKNGFLVPVRNSRLLADKMIWMLEHPDEVQNMAIQSRKYAEARFDVNNVNDMLISRLLDGNADRR